MRRSSMIYLITILLVLSAAVIFSGLQGENDIVRYQQHEREPAESDLGPCTVCGGTSGLCTHLPLLSIDTGGQKIPGNPVRDEEGVTIYYETSAGGAEEIRVSVDIRDKEGSWHHLTDEPDETLTALFRIRGNSSRGFSKKSYRIQLIDADNPEQDNPQSLLGMPEGSEWALHGPFLDKTLIRNYMWMNLSAQVMGYAPSVRFCEVTIDGQYQGLYVLMETITVSPQRVNLTEYEEGNPVFSYLVRLEPNYKAIKQIDNFTFYTMRMEPGTGIELLYPGTSRQTAAVKQYVQSDFSFIERYLYSRDMSRNPDSCWDYLDLDSFVDYYILQEFLAVSDSFSASTYFYKDVRGKLHVGPVWDYNNALNNFFHDLPETGYFLAQKGWFTQLMKSPRFVERVIERYHSLRKGVLSEQYIEKYTSDVITWLGSAIDRNYEVWGYSFDSSLLSPYERRSPSSPNADETKTIEALNPHSFEEAVEWMLDYAQKRGRWMDEYIHTLRQYCHSSRNAGDIKD